MDNKKHLPSWGVAVDAAVASYVEAMEHWIVGNLDWSFKTLRYFGPQNEEIRLTRIVSILPQEYEEDHINAI